ncbi:MAG: hypothetical protein EOR04_10335 [Mesorhizobium sp.]|uniref:AAA family ATPase n=1 Tax=Mesorhizobium sp. TaxID=1871066 RepID=UPI000FE89D73|nr:AAA family ATPase [Mesorhizobium sp.]RWP42959.1 MAG: hypothetical protein EOR04_10335 [Mesorhizobium sp.]
MFFFDHASRDRARPLSLNQANFGGEVREIESFFATSDNERRQTDLPPVWKRPFDKDVVASLSKLSYQKCPFCEQTVVQLEPYRFRPPAYAEPAPTSEDKACYLWLAFNWKNLFPICIGCIPASKNRFPVVGARARPPTLVNDVEALFMGKAAGQPDEAILLYPGEMTQPETAFSVSLDGRLRALQNSARAEETIAHFKLNRPDLLDARKIAFDRLIGVLVSIAPMRQEDFDGSFRRGEFGGACFLMLHRVAKALSEKYDPRASLGVKGLQKTLLTWSRRPDFSSDAASAIDALRQEDRSQEPEQVPSTPPVRPASWPRLRSVSIKNYKSLSDLSLALPVKAPYTPPLLSVSETVPPDAPCLLILGENATGKSSVLEAVALASVPNEVRDTLGLAKKSLRLRPDYMGSPNATQPERAEIDLKFSDGSRRAISITDKNEVISTITPDDATGPLIFAYGAHRMYGETRRLDVSRHVDTLFSRTREVSNPEPWLIELAKNDTTSLDEVVSALRNVIQIEGRFEEIRVEPAADGEPERCVISIKKTRENGEPYTYPQRLDIASSGYRAVLALVCDVLQGLIEVSRNTQVTDPTFSSGAEVHAARRVDAIVLIDEIEAHLHPRWKVAIMAGLRRAFPRVTFIVTSHDPLCLRGMLNGEVIMLNRYQNASGEGFAEVVEPVAVFESTEDLTIEQLLTSNLFQLFSTDAPQTDDAFSVLQIALANKRAGTLTDTDREVLRRFDDEIAAGLPYGKTEITLLVQEAVAEYLSDRRKVDQKTATRAKRKAQRRIKAFLKDLIT